MGAAALEGAGPRAPVLGDGRGGVETAPPSQDHLGRDAEEQVVVAPPYLQQQRGLGQHGLLQLTRVGQGPPVDLDDDVAILDTSSANGRERRSQLIPERPGPGSL